MSARRIPTRPLLTALGLVAAVGLVGCASLTPSPTGTSTSTTKPAADDVSVKLGALLPLTGASAAAGASTLAAVQLAVDEINSSDLGLSVELVEADAGSAGDGLTTAGAQSLVDAGVDAVIGPRSSSQSLEVYEMFADAGIVEVSPSSTLPSIADLVDDGYFFRTAPSDALQSQVLGNRILFDGATTIGIIRTGDAYSVALDEGLAATFDFAGAAIVSDVVVEPGAEVDAAAALLATSPEAVVVIAPADAFPPIAEALTAAGIDWSSTYGTDASLEAFKDRTDVGSIAGAVFSSPGVLADSDFRAAIRAVNPDVRLFNFAPEAYDAVMLVGLAALEAGSSVGSDIRDHMIPVSGGPGTVVQTFADGAALIADGQDIDYDGVSGPVDFTADGDIGAGFVSFYRYGALNALSWFDQAFGRIDAS
jgi:branched-chain amino acid transport system substrate-binding protein